MTDKQLFAKLKAIDARIKRHNQASEGAYEMAINDKGAAIKRWQSRMDQIQSERDRVVAELRKRGY